MTSLNFLDSTSWILVLSPRNSWPDLFYYYFKDIYTEKNSEKEKSTSLLLCYFLEINVDRFFLFKKLEYFLISK